MPPSELIEMQPPVMSAGPSLPSRAVAASSPISLLICSTPFLSASFTTGTTNPLGVSAAKPILTPRETEVLMRLVDGDSVANVARLLFMSESTVKTHVARVYEKLGAHNRASAIMSAVRLGFVKPDRPETN